ncbi:MAG: M28 family peptidase [Candidatus Thermoplasmatota archaeon]|nr:M28 family peptidase [Candidatus Thermoplasmatota archaeon]
MCTHRKILEGLLMLLILSALFCSSFEFHTDIISESYIEYSSDELSPVSALVNESEIVEMIKNVNKTDIKKYLEHLVEFGPKWTGTESCDEAAQYIFNNIKQMGLDVEYQNWSFPLRKGKNVIATQHGIDPKSDAVFIICAHYDTSKGSPGANDDGSGIAAMLTIANITCKYSFNHTLRFIALSGHECGPANTYGSTYYAKKAYAKKENIVGVLNLDMIGNTSKTGNAIQIHGAVRSIWLLDFIDQINQKYNGDFDIIIERFHNTLGADENSFLDYGYDAVLFIQSNFWEPPNHVPEDDLSTIDFFFLTNVTKMILAVTVELADKPIDIKIQITNPSEGYFYISDKLFFKLPGFLNLRKLGLRGMTFTIQKSVNIKVDIDTDDEIKYVWFILDNYFNYKRVVSEPPYEFEIKKPSFRFKGKHTIGAQVITYSGKTAYDEMDIFFLP